MDKLDRQYRIQINKTPKKKSTSWEQLLAKANTQGFTWNGRHFINLEKLAKELK